MMYLMPLFSTMTFEMQILYTIYPTGLAGSDCLLEERRRFGRVGGVGASRRRSGRVGVVWGGSVVCIAPCLCLNLHLVIVGVLNVLLGVVYIYRTIDDVMLPDEDEVKCDAEDAEAPLAPIGTEA